MEEMSVLWLSALLGSIAWTVPVFRQYNHKYFWFFLFIAIQNPIATVVNLFLVHDTNFFNLLLSILQMLAIWHDVEFGGNKKKMYYLLIILSIAGLGACQFLPLTSQLMLSAVYRAIMLVLIATDSLFHTIKTKSINLFFMFLIFNEVVILLKLAVIVSEVTASIYYFLVSNMFAVLLGLYFWYYRYDQPKLKINLEKFI